MQAAGRPRPLARPHHAPGLAQVALRAGSGSRMAMGMKRVAVFGNAGGGKSTLAKRLAQLAALPLHPLDLIQYRAGGGQVPDDEFLEAHAALLREPEWIIDGYGSVASAWQRFAAADTLVYIDLPVLTHYRWVTKRLIKGLFMNPEGWPKTVRYGAAP